jgi:hypothetical protein
LGKVIRAADLLLPEVIPKHRVQWSSPQECLEELVQM